jgi:hypothetical protein
VEGSRTTTTIAIFGFVVLLAIVALWQTVDGEACAASDLELAHCQTAVDGVEPVGVPAG